MAEKYFYQRNPEFIFRKIVDELVLVPACQKVADMDCIYSTNAIGAFIWEKLADGATFDALGKAVLEEYANVGKNQAISDVKSFLSDLEQAGAVKRIAINE